MKRFFRLDEAERILPEVRTRMEDAIRLRRELEDATATLRRTMARLSALGGALVDRDAVAQERSREHDTAAALQNAIAAIHEFGCQVKDLDQGLVDFPTRFRGREVLLCWKFGEPGIQWWHGLDEGFRGRKPIDDDFRVNHQGDSVS